MEKVVKFSINNWYAGEDYPAEEPFIGENGWLKDSNIPIYLGNDEWCKQNKICVIESLVDMSLNFCVTATLDWVEKNCPSILNTEFEYNVEEDSDTFDIPFLDYNPENFGVKWYDCDAEDFVTDNDE